MVGAVAVSASAAQARCEIEMAPGTFEFKKVVNELTALPTNSGIIPRGFVALRDGTNVVHGIDASRYQGAVDFEKVKFCGGKFAIIRLSAGSTPDNELEYRSMWANARSVKLLVGPYHNLWIHDVPNGVSISSLDNSQREELRAKNIESAKTQAALFARRLNEVLSLDPHEEGGGGQLGQPYLPIALDISVRPQARGSAADRKLIGQIYGDAICTWIAAIRENPLTADQPVMLSTSPYIYRDYGLAGAKCDLKANMVWIGYHTLDGGTFTSEKEPDAKAAIAGLCTGPQEQNRCLIHQYTSYGGFAFFRDEPGLDLNRFYGTEDQLAALLQRGRR